MASKQENDWLTTPVAAAMIGVSAQTLSRHVEDGVIDIPFIKTPGGQYRFKESDIFDYLKSISRGSHPSDTNVPMNGEDRQ